MRPKIDPLNPNSPGFGQRLQENAKRDFESFQQNYDNILTQRDNFPANSRMNEEVSGNYLTGPPAHTAQGFEDLINSREQWGQDPLAYGRPFTFGAGERGLNFDRYYAHPSFKKLGFDPHRDNEAVYNKNTGWLSDFQRAIPHIVGNIGLGIRDMATEWTDWGGDPDVEHGEEMVRNIQKGYSTRGGLGGWVTNFAANMGYTMGIMAELAMEEYAFAGITAATGGLALPEAGAAAVARAAVAGSKIGSAGRMAREWATAFKAIRTPEQASSFYKAAQATGKYLNPFERTTEFLGEFSKLKGMANYAKASRGAMAFFGDVRMLNAVTSESKLEGGITKTDLNKALVDNHYDKFGEFPGQDKIKEFNEIADRGALQDLMANIPLIYLSNKVVFDGAMQGTRILRDSAVKTATRELAGKLGKTLVTDPLKPAELVSKWSRAGLKESFRPGNILKGTLRYTSRNLVEGLQENAQDIIHNTLMDYYQKYYDNPTTSSMKSAFGKGLLSQVSAQGLDTFLSGFLMGGALGAVQKPLFVTLPQLGRKVLGDTKTAEKVFGKGYTQWKKEKEDYINSFINIYNEIKKNPRTYMKAFDSIDENFVSQSDLKDKLGNSKGYAKTVMDVKDEQAFHHVYSMLQNNQVQFLKDLISDYKQMTPEQLEEAFGKEKDKDELGMDIKQRLNNFSKKVDMVESIYNQHVKYNPNPISKKEALASPQAFSLYNSFEDYRKVALFAHYAFERAADRSASILESAARNKPFEKASVTDLTILYSPTDLQDQLKALRQEISLLKGSTDSKAKSSLKSKQDRLDSLGRYQVLQETLRNVHAVRSGAEVSREKANKKSKLEGSAAELPYSQHIEELNGKLYNAYNDYLKTLAEEYNEPLLDTQVQDTFKLLRDFFENHQDRIDMARAVNMFSNPDYVTELLSQIHNVKTKLDDEQVTRAAKGVEKFIDQTAWNELILKLYDKKVVIPPDQLDKLLEFVLPVRLMDIDNKFIPLDSEQGKEAIELIKEFFARMKGTPTPVVTTPVATSIPGELETMLRAAFDKESTKRQARGEAPLHDFNKFTKENSIALDIIDAYGKPIPSAKPAPVKAAETPEPTSELDFLPEYKNKIIWGPSGSGKTWIAEKISNTIDSDDLLLEEMIKHPGFEKATRETFGKGYDSPLSWLKFVIYLRDGGAPETEQEVYDRVADKMIAYKEQGKTVLTGSEKFAQYADIILLTTDKKTLTRKIPNPKAQQIQDRVLNTAESLQIPVELFTGDIADKLLTKAVPEVISEVVSETIQDRIDKTTTLKQLNSLTKQLKKEVAEGTIKEPVNVIKEAIKVKRKQLATEVTFDKIKKGDILVMKDRKTFLGKGLAQVLSKSSKEFKVQSWSNGEAAGAIHVYNADKINEAVDFIFDNELTSEDVTPVITPESEAIAKENLDIDKNTSIDTERRDELKDNIDDNDPFKDPCP